jgi:acyl phosphate:glycerol-3-phosphate acyltransferase
MRIEYLIPLISYLLGSIPFGYILVKFTQGKDIRSFGSGDIGATNMFRKSCLSGILTLMLDTGKGAATGCGAYLAISPLAVLTTLVLFVLILCLTQYILAASIGATAFFPLWAYLYGKPAPLLIGSALGAVLIIVKHHQNFRRLLSGTENKFALGTRS